jgi:hypothetical protein
MSPEWSIFQLPDHVTLGNNLYYEGCTGEIKPFNFLHNIVRYNLPTLQTAAVKQ